MNIKLPPGWHIEYNPKPIPIRDYDYDYWHDDYDGAVDGNHLYGTAASPEKCLEEINEKEEELCD